MKFSTAFVLLSGAPAAMGFQSVGKIYSKCDFYVCYIVVEVP